MEAGMVATSAFNHRSVSIRTGRLCRTPEAKRLVGQASVFNADVKLQVGCFRVHIDVGDPEGHHEPFQWNAMGSRVKDLSNFAGRQGPFPDGNIIDISGKIG